MQKEVPPVTLFDIHCQASYILTLNISDIPFLATFSNSLSSSHRNLDLTILTLYYTISLITYLGHAYLQVSTIIAKDSSNQVVYERIQPGYSVTIHFISRISESFLMEHTSILFYYEWP